MSPFAGTDISLLQEASFNFSIQALNFIIYVAWLFRLGFCPGRTFLVRNCWSDLNGEGLRGDVVFASQ
jgi:hypothetical protein